VQYHRVSYGGWRSFADWWVWPKNEQMLGVWSHAGVCAALDCCCMYLCACTIHWLRISGGNSNICWRGCLNRASCTAWGSWVLIAQPSTPKLWPSQDPVPDVTYHHDLPHRVYRMSMWSTHWPTSMPSIYLQHRSGTFQDDLPWPMIHV